MKVEKMHMNTNARIVSKVLTRNRSTFYALKELINNSIQADSTCIEINLLPSQKDNDDLTYNLIERIQVIDNGRGVPYSKFRKSILELATDNKPDGCGVGRFRGLQIGRNMRISTIGFDEDFKVFTQTNVTFDVKQFEKDDLTTIEFNVENEILSNFTNCGYNVEIFNLYSNEIKCAKKNKLGSEFLPENFSLKLFEHYPLYIFNQTIKFIVNGYTLKRTDFVIETPKLQRATFMDSFGKAHEVRLQYFNLKLNDPKVRLFIQCLNGDVQSTALELTYNSMWYSPSMGTQYILIESEYLTRDFIDSCALGDLNKEWQKFAQFLKFTIDDYYKKNNSKYTSFIKKLKTDKYYPYTPEESSSGSLSSNFFEQSAFIVEEDLKLLNNDNSNRALIYLLLRKVIDDGNISFIIEHIMGLSKQSQTQLIGLLDKTNLEEVISFSTQITNKLQSLELLEKIVLSEIEKHIDLYQEVSKTIFRNSWLMGEEYSNSIPMPPQQYIIDILENLFATYIPIKANRKTNIVEGCKTSVKKLTSQITYNERRLDYGKKEISAIVILAPSIQVSQYETSCIDSFLYALGNNNGYSKEKIVFKIYFIASRLDDFARQRINKAVSERFVYPNMNPDSDGYEHI